MANNTSQRFRDKLTNPIHPNSNPEYEFWHPEWSKLRDVILGQKQLRAMGTIYLPAYAKMTAQEYADYLRRVAFYNMTSRTLDGMIGTSFLRNPKTFGIEERLERGLDNIGKKGSTLLTFTKQITEEIIKVGRVGVLCDMAVDGGEPYFASYLAENIIDWELNTSFGRDKLTMVVLRELVRNPNDPRGYDTIFRVLRLIAGQYEQHVFFIGDSTSVIDFDTAQPDQVIVPTLRGKPFDFIPFVFFGARSNEPEVEKPPLLDIADINLAHYSASAQLEQGRWYTGLPIYFAEVGPGGEKAEYDIAPNVVWQLTQGAKAGIIEFNGSGLKSLENSLKEKENQISALGGRMITNRADSTGKSEEETKMNERNERSLLINVSKVLDDGFTQLLQWWASWQGQRDVDEVNIRFNKDFMLDKLAAREFRAFTDMYQKGILPIEVLFEVFQRINVIPDVMTLESFKEALDNPENFPNNPDLMAQREGFPDARSKFSHDEAILAAKRVEAQQAQDQGDSNDG